MSMQLYASYSMRSQLNSKQDDQKELQIQIEETANKKGTLEHYIK